MAFVDDPGMGGIPRQNRTKLGIGLNYFGTSAGARGGVPQAQASPFGGMGAFDPRSNPYYQQMISQMNAMGASDAANTRASIQQALIAFGLVPGGFKDQMGALDDATRALIQKNTDTGISGYARLLEAKKTGITDLVNRLQARGLRRSGAKGYGLRRNQLGFDRNLADALASLLSNTGGAYANYASGEQQRQMAIASALASAYQNYFTSAGDYGANYYGGGGGPTGLASGGTAGSWGYGTPTAGGYLGSIGTAAGAR